MIGFFGWLLRNAIGVVVGIVAVPLLARWVWTTAQALPWPPPQWWALVIGLGGAVGIHLWRRPSYFLHTYIHENAHALVCLLVRVPIRGFTATDGQGGAVAHVRTDPVRETMILMAPYVLPFFMAPGLLVRQFLPSLWPTTGSGWGLAVLQAIAGLAIGWQLLDLAQNIRFNFVGRGTDLQRVGQVLAVVLIVLAWLLLMLWAAIAVTGAGVPVA